MKEKLKRYILVFGLLAFSIAQFSIASQASELDNELLAWGYIDDVVENLNEYGYDIGRDYKYKTKDLYETAENIEERLQQVFF